MLSFARLHGPSRHSDEGSDVRNAHTGNLEISGLGHRFENARALLLLTEYEDHFFFGYYRQPEKPKPLTSACAATEKNRGSARSRFYSGLTYFITVPSLYDAGD